jgi:queuine/archaeosine tRNA-ribosyltransferase
VKEVGAGVILANTYHLRERTSWPRRAESRSS